MHLAFGQGRTEFVEYKQCTLLETIITEAVHSHPDAHFCLAGTIINHKVRWVQLAGLDPPNLYNFISARKA